MRSDKAFVTAFTFVVSIFIKIEQLLVKALYLNIGLKVSDMNIHLQQLPFGGTKCLLKVFMHIHQGSYSSFMIRKHPSTKLSSTGLYM